MSKPDKIIAGVPIFPGCGCHYTTDDDGIIFCPLHAAAEDLLASCQEMRDRLWSEFQAAQREAFASGQTMDKWPILTRANAVIAKAGE